MIELTEIKRQPGDGFDQYQIQAFADTKEEVTPGCSIHNLPANAVIQPGSSIITADGELAFLKSDGTWNWVS